MRARFSLNGIHYTHETKLVVNMILCIFPERLRPVNIYNWIKISGDKSFARDTDKNFYA